MSPQRISLQTLKYSLCKGHLHLLGLKAKAMGLPHRGPTSWERQDSDHLQISLQGNRDFFLYLPSQLQYTAMATPNLIWMAKTYTNLYEHPSSLRQESSSKTQSTRSFDCNFFFIIKHRLIQSIETNELWHGGGTKWTFSQDDYQLWASLSLQEAQRC